MLPIILRGPNGEWLEEPALVDSGADHTILPLFLLRELGIDRSQCQRRAGRGMGGSTRALYWAGGLDAMVLDEPGAGPPPGTPIIRLDPRFARVKLVLLGRSDFFKSFIVTVDQHDADPNAASITLEA